jgi:hypothetical protein
MWSADRRDCVRFLTLREKESAVGVVRKNPADFGCAELNEIGDISHRCRCTKIRILAAGCDGAEPLRCAGKPSQTCLLTAGRKTRNYAPVPSVCCIVNSL